MTAPDTDTVHPDTVHPDTVDPDTVHHIPLAEIDPLALPRDRTSIDAAELAELKDSIVRVGMRLPVELFPLASPKAAPTTATTTATATSPTAGPEAPPVRWGILSGYRRFRAMRELHDFQLEAGCEPPRFGTLAALIRPRAALAEQLAAVVEENEIRAELSPWERGHVAVAAFRRQIFGSIDEAVAKLYPSGGRMKRSRLRAIAQLVDELDGLLTEPEHLNQRQCLRLAAALQAGFGDVMRTALEETSRESPEAQWQLLLSILTEAEQPASEGPRRPGRPRRVLRPRPGLTIRRERTQEGYIVHFTGRDATCLMLDDVFDEIERLFSTE